MKLDANRWGDEARKLLLLGDAKARNPQRPQPSALLWKQTQPLPPSGPPRSELHLDLAPLHPETRTDTGASP